MKRKQEYPPNCYCGIQSIKRVIKNKINEEKYFYYCSKYPGGCFYLNNIEPSPISIFENKERMNADVIFPDEIWIYIFQFLDIKTVLTTLPCICRKWQILSKDDQIGKIFFPRMNKNFDWRKELFGCSIPEKFIQIQRHFYKMNLKMFAKRLDTYNNKRSIFGARIINCSRFVSSDNGFWWKEDFAELEYLVFKKFESNNIHRILLFIEYDHSEEKGHRTEQKIILYNCNDRESLKTDARKGSCYDTRIIPSNIKEGKSYRLYDDVCNDYGFFYANKIVLFDLSFGKVPIDCLSISKLVKYCNQYL